MTKHILFVLREIIIKEYSNLLLNEPVMLGRRLRIVLTDGSIVDMRYPIKEEYSFHWQRKDGSIIRIDTAPYHPDIKTYPNHKHYLSEENILPDDVTDPSNMPEINCRKFESYFENVIAIAYHYFLLHIPPHSHRKPHPPLHLDAGILASGSSSDSIMLAVAPIILLRYVFILSVILICTVNSSGNIIYKTSSDYRIIDLLDKQSLCGNLVLVIGPSIPFLRYSIFVIHRY